MRTLTYIFFFSLLVSACGANNSNSQEEVIASINETVQVGDPVVLSVTEFKEKLEIPDVQLIDVRTDAEVENGIIKDAVQMDISDWDSFVISTASLDKSKPVLVYCKAGGRSAKAASYLSEQGYQVFDLEGGYDAWKQKQ
jgi:rhodanese-related sulfurtransferase